MFEHKNLYPVVLVPGVVGYSEDTLPGKIIPCFGTTATSVSKVIKSMGMDCHTASFGLVSGIWDRTCELYAQIFGGRVDYGEAHSKHTGHARFGKLYPKMFTEDPEKINLIAYGFGAPVARLLIDLLCNGSQEEISATAPDKLSGLFKGGNKGFVHSLVTIAGVNSGITLPLALEIKIPDIKKLYVEAAAFIENIISYTGYIDPYYKKHGLTLTQHGFSFDYKDKKAVIDEESLNNYLSKTDDNIFYEIGLDGMDKFNRNMSAAEDTYYISFAGSVTKNLFGKITIPTLKAGICAPSALLISTFENYLPEYPTVTGETHENDGLVNTDASLPPVSEYSAAFKSADRCVPGVWYMMPISERNHLSFAGLFQRPDKYRNEVYELMKLICNLE